MSAAMMEAGEFDQALLELADARPKGRWRRTAAGGLLSFVISVLVLAAMDDPAVAVTLLIVLVGIACGIRWLRRRWKQWRHPETEHAEPRSLRLDRRRWLGGLAIALLGLACVTLPIVVQSGFDSLHAPWNFLLLGGCCALGGLGFWTDHQRRQRRDRETNQPPAPDTTDPPPGGTE